MRAEETCFIDLFRVKKITAGLRVGGVWEPGGSFIGWADGNCF
jgi:hypothetical protein